MFTTILNASSELTSLGPFIKINHADWSQNPLNVYVIAKDEYSKKFIPQVVRTIHELSDILKTKSTNPHAWDFKITVASNYPNFIQTIAHPINIAVELKHEGFDCKPQAIGWWHDTNPVQQIFNRRAVIEVFTGCNDPNLNGKGVDIHRMDHEMLHGLGLEQRAEGKKAGDFMCGLDPIGEWKTIYTCEGARDNYDDGS